MRANGIATGIHYPIPLPSLNAYKHLNCGPHEFPKVLQASTEILSLPIFPKMSDSDAQDVIMAVRKVLDAFGR